MKYLLKYLKGQEFETNRLTEFPEGYENLNKGTTFKIEIALEECDSGKLDYPYLVAFENGFKIALDEKDIEELAKNSQN